MHHRRRSTTSLIHKYARAAAPMGVTTLDAAIPQSTGPTTLEAMASAMTRSHAAVPTSRPCPKGRHIVIPTRGAKAGIPVCRGPATRKVTKSAKITKKAVKAADKAMKAARDAKKAVKAAKVASAKAKAAKAAKKAVKAVKKAKAAKRAVKTAAKK